jgi:hypothetical protein
MFATAYPKTALTSEVIPTSPDGTYPYDVLGFLIPHEMLRREFQRGSLALQHLNCSSSKAKWQCDAFVEWLDDFLIPLLHGHHYVEDNIIFPFYFALGVIAPERQAEDHVSLIGRMNKLQSLNRQLCHFMHHAHLGHTTNGINSVDQDKALLLEGKVKKEFKEMISHFQRHFAEEEEFWPELLRKYGEVSSKLSCCYLFILNGFCLFAFFLLLTDSLDFTVFLFIFRCFSSSSFLAPFFLSLLLLFSS